MSAAGGVIGADTLGAAGAGRAIGAGAAAVRGAPPVPVPRGPAASRPSGTSARTLILATGLAGIALLVHGLWIPAKAALAQLLLERAWRRALAGEVRPRPWPWADTWPVARLVLPAPESGGEPDSLIVLAGASGRTLAFAPGYLDGSARPGDDGNVVIAGHRDTHFRALARLAPGDEVVLEVPALRRRYRVAAARVADKSRTDLLAETAVPTLTLITCWPFDAFVPGGPLRYVVTALAVP